MATTTFWQDAYFESQLDLALGVVHVVAGVLAIFGNGAVFFSFLKTARQRASACLFVQLAVAGVFVGLTSLYGGFVLLRGRVYSYQLQLKRGSTLTYLEIIVGHCWWYGFFATVLLVTMLSGIRAWSIARPFKYKLHTATGHTLSLSIFCWLFGILWLGIKHLLGCSWSVQVFFTYSMPSCDVASSIGKKVVVFPLDFLPVFFGAFFTSLSNGYVIKELARSFRNPPITQQTAESFTRTTFIIVCLTSLFLVCFLPSLLFFFLNSLEEVAGVSVISTLSSKLFVYLFLVKFLLPVFYPALSPALQFCAAPWQRERLTMKRAPESRTTALSMLHSKRSSRGTRMEPAAGMRRSVKTAV